VNGPHVAVPDDVRFRRLFRLHRRSDSAETPGLNAGWLDWSADFPVGQVSRKFVAALLYLLDRRTKFTKAMPVVFGAKTSFR
jgi:hypothetical protein